MYIMNDFESIKSIWNNQISSDRESPTALIKKAKAYEEKVLQNHIWIQVILSVTWLVLVVFFFFVLNATIDQASIGAFLMLLSLGLRILIEFSSKKHFKRLNMSKEYLEYVSDLAKFYSKRRRIHILFTPIILIAYASGFILLLPYFKASLTLGFYNYVWISSIVLLVFFSIFIFRQIREELKILNKLKAIGDTIT